jgi:hypothetical protein
LNAGSFGITNAGAISGATNLTLSGAISGGTTITTSGLITSVGLNSGSGLIQGTGGITNSGTTTLSGLSAGGIVKSTSGTGVLTTGTLNLASSAEVGTSILPIANGGTGNTTFATNGLVYGNGAGALSTSAAGTSGQILLASATGVPTFVTLTSDATISSTGVLTIANNAINSAKIADGTVTGTDIATSTITNVNLASGAFSNITGTGALTSGSIASGFGSISTTNGIDTTGALQGGTLGVAGATTLSGGLAITTGGNFTTQRNTTDITSVGTQNDLNLGVGSLFRFNNASALSVTGLASGTDGRRVILVNASASNVTLNNNDSGSAVANRIITGTAANISLAPGSSIELIYDSASSLWRATGDVAGGTGLAVTTLGAVSATSNANGGTITGNTLNLSVANATNAGLVSTIAQTFSGAKTFNTDITIGDGTVANKFLTFNQTGASSSGIQFGGTGTPYSIIYDGALSNIELGANGTSAIFDYAGLNINRSLQIGSDLGSVSADALTVTNGTSTANIAVFKDGATNVLTIADNGNLTATGLTTLTSLSAGGIVKSTSGTGVLTTGTLNLASSAEVGTSILPIANGGTNATTAAGARTNLGAAVSGANSDITSLTGLTTALSVPQGGTGTTSLTQNGVVFGNGTSPLVATAAGVTGQCLVATTGSVPTWGSCGTGFINNSTALQTTANFNIQSDAATSKTGVLRAATGQTVNILELQNSAGSPLANFDSGGRLVIDSTTEGDNLVVRDRATGNDAFVVNPGPSALGATVSIWRTIGGSDTDAQLQVNSFAAANKLLVLKEQNGGTALTIQDNTATDVAKFDYNTGLDIGTLNATGVNLQTNGTTRLSIAAGGAVTIANLSAGGIVKSASGTGVLSAGTLNLASATEVGSSILGVANGGTGSSTAFTTGSIVFADAGGQYSQNNANFFWDNTNSRLGLSNSTPGNKLSVNIPVTADGLAQNLVATGSVTNKGIVIQGVAGQTADLFQTQRSSGARALAITSTGSILSAVASGAPALTNDVSGSGLVLAGINGAVSSQLRITSNNNAWADAQVSSYFQVTNSTNNNLTFQGGGFGTDAQFNRLQFASNGTTFTDGLFTTTPAPTAVLEVVDSTASKVALKVKAAASQTANIVDVVDSTSALQLSVTATGNLLFGTGANRQISVTTQATANTAGNNLSILSAAGNGTGAGGVLTVQAGNGGATSGAGGLVSIQGGSAIAGNSNGGNVQITGGVATGTALGGDIVLTSGTGGAAGSSGNIILQGSNSATSAGGAVSILGGNSAAGVAGSGTVSIYAGNSGSFFTAGVDIKGGASGGTVAGGTIALTGGLGSGTASGGVVNITGGVGGATSGLGGGAVTIAGGASGATSGGGGLLTLRGGNALGTGVGAGGGVTIVAGQSTTTGVTGAVNISAANGVAASNTVGGLVTITSGAGGGTAAGGLLTIRTGNGGANGSGGTLALQAGNGGASAGAGGTVTIFGGNASIAGVNGGDVSLAGGTGVAGGGFAGGVVFIDTPVFTATSQAFVQTTNAQVFNIPLADVDNNSTDIITVSGAFTGAIVNLPAPSRNIQGRVFYVSAGNGSVDFALTPAGSPAISLKANSTATMVWNGTAWTAAGASSSTTLQAAYDNTQASAGGAEIIVAQGANSNGLTIRNSIASPITGAILEVQSNIGSNILSANNNAVELASNGGAEVAGASATTFPATTWSPAPAGPVAGNITRDLTTVNVATSQASVAISTTGVAGHGVRDRLSSALIPNLRYTVSFGARASGASFNTLNVLYSKDGTDVATTACVTGNNVTTAIWTRVTCTFIVPATGVTSANDIFIRQSDAATRIFYIDNLSVTVNASTNHAADGGVDDIANFATNYGNTGTGAVTRNTATIFDTSGSAQVVTTAAAGSGIRNNLSVFPQASTALVTNQYLVTFYAQSDVAYQTRVRYTRDGGTTFASCTDYNTQTVGINAWTKITCLFTTDLTAASAPRLYIDQTDTVVRTVIIDAVSVTLNTNNASNVQVGNGNKGGSATLFTLDRSAGAPIADNNDAYLGSMYYDTTTGRIQCYEADGWGACGAAPDNIVNLNPEYAGAVLNGSGVGTMTADFCSNDAALSVNTGFCSTGQAKNFYKWTSPQATQQTYSIYVTYQLPATFNGFSNDDTVTLTARTDSITNAAVTYEMFKSTGSAVTRCGTGETTVVTTANTWQSVGINGNEATGCSFASTSAGNFVIFKINVKANSNANAYVSTLSFVTTGR